MASKKTKLQVSDILVPPNRQRKEFNDIEELAQSIANVGLIHPIIVDDDTLHLIAGERRLRAVVSLGWTEVPIRWLSALSTDDLELIELEENIKRSNLTWQEETKAVQRLHAKLCAMNEGQTAQDTAKYLGFKNHASVTRHLRVAESLSDAKVSAATSLSSASNVVQRQTKRAIDTAISKIGEEIGGLFGQEEKPKELKNLVSQEDFCSFASTYSGRKFNLLHCDFPYGIGHSDTDQGNSATWGSYEDSAETYWRLVECLIDCRDKLLYSSAHIVFWFSLNYYETTRVTFEGAGFSVNPFPLIWHKTDNRGLLPDPKRGPRRVYETAFLMSYGDRQVVQAVSNVYAGPSSKALHISEKPVPMLGHFFRMLVDGHTELLDPTAGSGNAIIAALGAGAGRAEGLEISEEYCAVANESINNAIRNGLIKEEENV